MRSKDTPRGNDSEWKTADEAFETYTARTRGWADGCCTARLAKYGSFAVAGIAVVNEISAFEFSPVASSIAVAGALGGYALHTLDRLAERKMIVNELLAQVANQQVRRQV